MKRTVSAGIIICLVLAGGAVGMAKSHNQPEIALTEAILANRDHLKVLSAIDEMCTGKSAARNHDGPVTAFNVRAPLGSNEEVPYPVYAKADDVPDGC
jgi:hypothetical protein